MSSETEQPTHSEYPARWEERWQANATRWDQGFASPFLRKTIEERGQELGIPSQGNALVPGCGTGYDVLLFAQRGLHAVGLDLAPTGIKAAQKWMKEQEAQQEKPLSYDLVNGDFFEYSPAEGFDLIFDYTFLCALPPELRPKWAETMAKLSKPSSSTRLITLQFPLNGQPGGPPFSLSTDIYHELLDEHWEEIWGQEVPDELRRKTGPPGGERLAVWRRKAEAK